MSTKARDTSQFPSLMEMLPGFSEKQYNYFLTLYLMDKHSLRLTNTSCLTN